MAGSKKNKKIKTITKKSDIPMRFKSEDQEREFWETHGLSYKLCEELYDPEATREFLELAKKKRIKMTDRRKK